MRKRGTERRMQFVVQRLLSKATDALEASEENVDDAFVQGRRDAYFEMLDLLPEDLLVEELTARGW